VFFDSTVIETAQMVKKNPLCMPFGVSG